MKTSLVSFGFAACLVIGFLFGHQTNLEQKAQSVPVKNPNMTVNAPDPNHPGQRRFYTLDITRAVRSHQSPTVYGDVSEEPGDRDFIVDVDGNSYWGTLKPAPSPTE